MARSKWEKSECHLAMDGQDVGGDDTAGRKRRLPSKEGGISKLIYECSKPPSAYTAPSRGARKRRAICEMEASSSSTSEGRCFAVFRVSPASVQLTNFLRA